MRRSADYMICLSLAWRCKSLFEVDIEQMGDTTRNLGFLYTPFILTKL